MERNEAMEIVRKLYNESLFIKKDKEAMVTLIPELKESEDERIRKAIKLMYSFLPNKPKYIGDVSVEDMFAWLEKQGENHIVGNNEMVKPIDKVESKFHKGNWIVFNGLTLYIIEVVKGFYRTVSKGGIINSYDWSIDNVARLWDITKEAKPGDVLYSDCLKILWIFKGRDTVYCGCNLNYNDGAFSGEGHIETSTDAIPATKEQCDLLFQKMKEAGYEWDADKKELKKIEQKPAWSEEDETCLKNAIMYCEWARDKAPDLPCYETSEKSIDWLKSLRPQSTWKPSDEQIRRLEYFVKSWGKTEDTENTKVFETVKSLLNDLKQLKQL